MRPSALVVTVAVSARSYQASGAVGRAGSAAAPPGGVWAEGAFSVPLASVRLLPVVPMATSEAARVCPPRSTAAGSAACCCVSEKRRVGSAARVMPPAVPAASMTAAAVASSGITEGPSAVRETVGPVALAASTPSAASYRAGWPLTVNQAGIGPGVMFWIRSRLDGEPSAGASMSRVEPAARTSVGTVTVEAVGARGSDQRTPAPLSALVSGRVTAKPSAAAGLNASVPPA